MRCRLAGLEDDLLAGDDGAALVEDAHETVAGGAPRLSSSVAL